MLERSPAPVAISETGDPHHAYLRAELPALHHVVQQVAAGHRDEHPELDEVQEVFEALADELLGHSMKEEMVVAPMLESLTPAILHPVWRPHIVQNVLRVMRKEHAHMRDALARLRTLTRGFLAREDDCPACHTMLERLARLERATLAQIESEEREGFTMAEACR